MRVCVGYSMSEPDLIIKVIKLVVERKCVVIIDTLAHPVVFLQKCIIVKIEVLALFASRDLILEVLYVVTVSLPAIQVS